ncbi:MAG: anti-sigma factor family protein, partial [Planctomycetota bacterium]
MNHEDLTDRADLSAYLDGQLPPEQAARVERALAADPDLRAELKALDATRGLLGDLPPEKAPDGMLEVVMEQAERRRLLHAPEPSAHGRRFRWIRGLAAAAIIVLTVGLGLHLHHVLSEGDWVSQQPKTAHGTAEEGGEPLARDLPEPESGATTSRPLPSVVAPESAEPPTVAASPTAEGRPVRRAKGDGGGRGRRALGTPDPEVPLAPDAEGSSETALAMGRRAPAEADRFHRQVAPAPPAKEASP